MGSDQIEQILDKYWAGETSLEEESSLIQYFCSDQIAQQHLMYQPIFQVFSDSRDQKISASFEQTLIQKIAKESNPIPTPIKQIQTRSINRFIGIAASILIIIVAGLFIVNNSKNDAQIDLYADTFSSPEEALDEIKSAFVVLTTQMSESTAMVEDEIKKLDNLNNTLY